MDSDSERLIMPDTDQADGLTVEPIENGVVVGGEVLPPDDINRYSSDQLLDGNQSSAEDRLDALADIATADEEAADQAGKDDEVAPTQAQQDYDDKIDEEFDRLDRQGRLDPATLRKQAEQTVFEKYGKRPGSDDGITSEVESN